MISFFRHWLAAGVFVGLWTARASAEDLVIVDNDWNIPGSYVAQVGLMPLLCSPHVRVLGLASETGDCWRDEGTASLLRFMEDIGATDTPVVNGAVFPLINTRERVRHWEEAYGFIFWKGAWNDPSRFPASHPDDPYYVAPLKDGMPTTKPSKENAADFLIREVHEHPHQVTILEAGPMTNLAIAIAMDPELASLAKELVFQGGRISQLGSAEGLHSDFNILFDPEAAHMVLAAPWPRIVSVAEVSEHIILDRAMMDRIQAHPSAAGAYLARNSALGLPLWEDVAAEIIADPTLVTKTIEVSMDVETDHGMTYGMTIAGSPKDRPKTGVATVIVVQEVDAGRLAEAFVAAVQSAPRHPKP